MYRRDTFRETKVYHEVLMKAIRRNGTMEILMRQVVAAVADGAVAVHYAEEYVASVRK